MLQKLYCGNLSIPNNIEAIMVNVSRMRIIRLGDRQSYLLSPSKSLFWWLRSAIGFISPLSFKDFLRRRTCFSQKFASQLIDDMDPKIVIIGAGASGIAAGTKLLELGFKNIVILEAENRYGGRINTIQFGDNVLDMGAQWCHGEEDNVVYNAIKHLKPFDSSQAQYNRFDCFRSNKEFVPKDVTDRLTCLVQNILLNSRKELQYAKGISLGMYLTKKFEEALKEPEYSYIDKELAGQFFEMYKKYENSVESCDSLFDASGSGYGEYWECEGDTLLNWKDKGYVSFLRFLMGVFPNEKNKNLLENRILLNKTVEEIIWDSPGDYKVHVKCADGDNIEADHVICTVSLGVLKERHPELFIPCLPEQKVRAIEGLTIGTVDKLFIQFSEPFWPKGWVGFNLMWLKEDIDTIRLSKDSWLEDVFGFYMVDYQPNILCGWISGTNARRMEMLSDKETLDGLMYVLRKFLVWNIPDPVGFKRSTWHKNQNFRGSYTYRSMAAERLNVGPADLAKPLRNSTNNLPVLLFAGEATHNHYYSTVHGAVESGWREANRLDAIYSSSNEKFKIPVPLSDKRIFDVIILGAGLAGLGAGIVLKNSHTNFIILEAQNYIGGRVRTKRMQSLNTNYTNKKETSDLINLGAQWLHGEQNTLFKIAAKNKLLTSELSEEGLGSYIREDGYILDELFHKKIDFIVGEILNEWDNYAHSEIYPKSVQHYLDEKFLEYTEHILSPNEREYALQLLDWHKRFQIIDNSCLSLSDVSAKYWGLYSFNGESCQAHINFRNGFGSVVDTIVDEIDRKHIRTDQVVSMIDWNIMKNDKKLCSIRTTDGHNYLAKHVIVTFSLGVLKQQQHKIFNPCLPPRICTAINDIGFEAIDKIFLQFDHPWWRPMEGIQLIFSEMNYKNANWTRYLSGFDILNPGAPNTLIGWVGSYGAIEMEKLSDQEIIDDCIGILAKFTKRDVPQPIKFQCSRWGTNEYIRGGYSYISTKCDDSGSTGKTLSEPVTTNDLLCDKIVNYIDKLSINDNGNCRNTCDCDMRPILLFAGEACHDKYFSTAHGAFLSGMEQAQRILNYF